MDFFLNDDQQELSALSRRVLSDRVTEDRLREIEASGDRFDPALWADLASAGILAAALPGPRSAGRWLRRPTSRQSCSAPAHWPGSAPRTSSAGGPGRPGEARLS